MKKKMIGLIVVMLLRAASQLCYGQYFQGLYDVDTSQDWGWDIFLHADGNYFIMGTMLDPLYGQWGLFNMQISTDGSAVLSKNIFKYNNVSLYDGNQGEIKILPNGGYLVPFSIQMVYGSQTRAWAGILKYSAIGDTIFQKTYTDTSMFWDAMNACAIMPDGGYILGGLHDHDTSGYYYPAYIIRTDSLGDTLWTNTYKKYPNQACEIFNIIPLPDGRIVAGAASERTMEGGVYLDYVPWYILLDSMGNIIRDTVYNIGFQVGGIYL